MKKKLRYFIFTFIMFFISLINADAAWTGNATGTGTDSIKNNGKPCNGCYTYCYSPCNNAWFSLVRLTLIYYDGQNYSQIGKSIYVGDYAGTDPETSTWKSVFQGVGKVHHWQGVKGWNSTESGFATHLKESVVDDVDTLLGWMGTSNKAITNAIKNGTYPEHKKSSGNKSDTGVRIIAELLVGFARVCGGSCGSYKLNVGTIKGLASQGNMSNDNFYKLANYLKLEHDDIGYSAPSTSKPTFAQAKASTAGWGIGIFSPWDETPAETKCDPGKTEETISKCCKELNITDKNKTNNTTDKLKRVITDEELKKYCTTRCNPGNTEKTIQNCCTSVGITNLNTTKNTEEFLTKTISQSDLQKYCSKRCNPGKTKSSIQNCCKELGITVGNQKYNTLDYLTETISKENLDAYCPNKCDPDKEGVVTCCKLFGITPTNQTNNTTMYLKRTLTTSELTNSECNPDYINCQYKLDQDMQGNCNSKTKGYITDENNEWKCVFYSTKSSYSEVKNHFKDISNDYCAVYCTEKIDYEFPLNSTKVYAGQYMVVKDSVMDPAIWPVRYNSRKTCRTTKETHSTEGYINVKQFEDDMKANEDAIKAAWDNYRTWYAKQEACDKATYSGQGTHQDCAEYGTIYYTYEGVEYSYYGCKRYETKTHNNYTNGKATYDGQTFTCDYKTSSCGCYSKPNYSSQISSALSTYNSLINKRNSMLNQINQCNNFTVDFTFEPKLKLEYEEPIYGDTFNLVQSASSSSSYRRFYTSGNASAGSGSYQGSAPTKTMQIRNCTWDNCKSTKSQTYPVTTWVEARKAVTKEYGLDNNVYRYIAKYSGRSFHTAAEAGTNYTHMSYSNLPVHVSTYPGKYDFRVITTTYGSGNKFTKYVFNGNTFAGKSYKKDGIYNCQYEIPCDRFIVKKDCTEFKARCGKQYQESGCSAELIYRTISLDTDKSSGSSLAFLTQSGSVRTPGDNWKYAGRVDEYIVNNRQVKGYEVYKQSPMYEITLTPALMKTIRTYNKSMNNRKVSVYEGTSKPTTGVAGYTSQDGLKCTDNGGHCTSQKIRDWGVKGCAIKGKTAGYSKCKGVTAW